MSYRCKFGALHDTADAPGYECVHCELDRLRAELAECRAILEKIVDPVRAMQRELPEGARLNGAMAVSLSNDASYLKGLAKAGLFDAARKGEGE